MYTVKLFSPWHTRDLIYGNVCFSPAINLYSADAALWEYWPDEQILSYSKPKAWYSWEPRWHSKYRDRTIKRARYELGADEWLYYANPNPTFRVSHITNCGGHGFYQNRDRLSEAVAIVSNYGGRFWPFRSGNRLRNSFVTHPLVSLYGRRLSWSQYRRWGLLSPKLPSNYKGELNWADAWMAEDQVQWLSSFKAVVCMENSIEPFYFTEKFYNAARAGCVPIYHAHPTVSKGILEGAFWIDPINYGFDVKETISAALNADTKQVQEQNYSWLNRPEVIETEFDGVWTKLARIFNQKLINQSARVEVCSN